ncbi:MAG: hypothetical protein R3273_12040, partial [Pseudidiomarina maritima]|nr:hypothetical protein [Pseudidiomarina maritima]
AGVQIDSTIMLMGAIVKVHWVFSFLVWSPSSLAKLARLERRLNEYQGAAVGQIFRCAPKLPQSTALVFVEMELSICLRVLFLH